MTEDEILWLDFEKAVEETLDVLFKARFDGLSGEEAKKNYEKLNEAWYLIKIKYGAYNGIPFFTIG